MVALRATLVTFAVLALVGCGQRELPVPSTAAEIGVRVTAIEGRVRVKRADALMWNDASLATILQKGDLISTDNRSTAKLQFTDGTLFNVRPDSMITILENSRDPSRQPHIGLGIESGQANFQTPGSLGDRRIETPNGRATPGRETKGVVQVARGGEAAVHIYEGRSEVETRFGQRLRLGPSDGIRIDVGGKAAPAPALTLQELAVPIAVDQGGTWSGVFRSPQLALETLELKGTQLHLVGRTERDAAVTLNGIRIPVQGDGSFNEHVVVLDNASTISVQARGTGGATTEQRMPVTQHEAHQE